jgi:hypothetical protein
MQDLDDADLDFEDAPVSGGANKTAPSEPVDEATCIALREIVFGRATGRGFPDVWLEQGFVFNDSVDRYVRARALACALACGNTTVSCFFCFFCARVCLPCE